MKQLSTPLYRVIPTDLGLLGFFFPSQTCMHGIHFCFLLGCVDTGQCFPGSATSEQPKGISPSSRHREGGSDPEKRGLENVGKKTVWDANRPGTIFVQNFSSRDVQMRPLWFFISRFEERNLIWLPQSFPSPQLQACSIACFSVGEQRKGNGYFFFSFTQQFRCSRRQEGNRTMEAADVEFLF